LLMLLLLLLKLVFGNSGQAYVSVLVVCLVAVLLLINRERFRFNDYALRIIVSVFDSIERVRVAHSGVHDDFLTRADRVERVLRLAKEAPFHFRDAILARIWVAISRDRLESFEDRLLLLLVLGLPRASLLMRR